MKKVIKSQGGNNKKSTNNPSILAEERVREIVHEEIKKYLREAFIPLPLHSDD